MSEVVVHGILGSPFVRAVRATLEEKGRRYRVQAMKPGEHKSAAYLALHPFGRVPMIEHDGFKLYETQAILRYLDAVFPEPALQPQDAKAAARMNQVMGINDWYLFPDVARVIVFQRIVGPAFFNHTPDEAVIAQAAPKVPVCIGELNRLLGGNAFFAGEHVSLADLLVAPQLDFLFATPEGRTAMQGTRLETWLKRMNARPSMQATLPPEPLRRAA
jgi:glutathione S-transferase